MLCPVWLTRRSTAAGGVPRVGSSPSSGTSRHTFGVGSAWGHADAGEDVPVSSAARNQCGEGLRHLACQPQWGALGVECGRVRTVAKKAVLRSPLTLLWFGHLAGDNSCGGSCVSSMRNASSEVGERERSIVGRSSLVVVATLALVILASCWVPQSVAAAPLWRLQRVERIDGPEIPPAQCPEEHL